MLKIENPKHSMAACFSEPLLDNDAAWQRLTIVRADNSPLFSFDVAATGEALAPVIEQADSWSPDGLFFLYLCGRGADPQRGVVRPELHAVNTATGHDTNFLTATGAQATAVNIHGWKEGAAHTLLIPAQSQGYVDALPFYEWTE